jgi:hypothetical protein
VEPNTPLFVRQGDASEIDMGVLIEGGLVCMSAMSPKHPRQSRRPVPVDVPETEAPNPSEGAKALTVNVPIETLNRAKTRASLEGTTMSAVVTDALTTYASGLQGLIAHLGLDKPTR